MSSRRPSRALLVLAGVLTQLLGVGCLVLGLAALPVVHDLHRGMGPVAASVAAAIAAIVCGTLVWGGRIVPLALAIGLDVGFGIALPRGGAAIGAFVHMLPAEDASTAELAIKIAAVAMFVAAVLCVLAIPSALAWRRWRLAGPSEPGPADTLPGVGPARGVPTQTLRTQPVPGRSRGLLIGGVALGVVAVGAIVIAAASGGSSGADATPDAGAVARAAASSRHSDPAPAPADAAAVPDAALPSLDDFAAGWHAALAHQADLPKLIAAHAFAFGPGAHDVAEGQGAVLAMLGSELGDAREVHVTFSRLGHEGDVGWAAEEVTAGSTTFVVTWVAGLADGAWTIAALEWAVAMPNATAYRLARDGTLPVPDAVPDTHDGSPLATAMRAAFASRAAFVAARSMRPDAFNFGSAPGERIAGGDAIKRAFGHLDATIHLHDAVRVGTIGDHGGWGAANVDFTDADRDSTPVTQTFRVLATWIHDDAGWRIVQTQWSNPRP